LLEKLLNNKLLFIAIHIVIGFLATLSWFPKIYGIVIISVSIVLIIVSKNKNEEALMFSSYLIGTEVFTRMVKGFFLYETGKYGVILFLFLGVILGSFKQKFSLQFVFYLLLLFLGVVFTQVPEGESIRNAISFNLSGPIVLGVTAFYCYKRPISKKNILNVLFLMLLPLFSMVTFLYFRTRDIKEIVFGGVASFETSGGFGPNQVATAIGLGVFIITIFMVKREKLSGFKILDALFLIYFIYRGLLTFSRGGIIAAGIAIGLFSFFYILSQNGTLKMVLKYLITSFIFFLSIWIYTSNITGGMLDNRYAGKNARGVQKEDITSGRIDIINIQFKNFLSEPLGIGVGNGKYKRQLSNENIAATSHNEAGRLIEEHGLIGLILLIGLLIIPLFNFYTSDNYQRAFIISFYALWFLTINHSAMRIAFPGFIYALSLIIITNNEE